MWPVPHTAAHGVPCGRLPVAWLGEGEQAAGVEGGGGEPGNLRVHTAMQRGEGWFEPHRE